MALTEKPYVRSLQLRKDFNPEIFPFTIPAIRALNELQFHEDVTFFIGENGSGKSTILEALALAFGFTAQGGTRNIMLEEAGTKSIVQNHLKVRKSYAKPRDAFFLRAETFYNVATKYDELHIGLKAFGGRSIHHRSHGEAFLTLLNKQFKGQGLYLLDEPEAALSPQRQLSALVRINDLVKLHASQFIIVTHSPILLSYPNARIFRCHDDGLNEIAYEDTEHYAVTRDFLNNYERRLEQLFQKPEDE